MFFSPIFLFVLKLEPNVAIGTALLTELFGFSSGLFAYLRARLIDFKVGLCSGGLLPILQGQDQAVDQVVDQAH